MHKPLQIEYPVFSARPSRSFTTSRSPIFRSEDNAILVIDEADKMLAPKYSHEENVSQSVQTEGLTLMEGTCVDIKDGSITYEKGNAA